MTRIPSQEKGEVDFSDLMVLLSLYPRRLAPPPSLHSRLRQRLENSQHESEWVFRIVSRPSDIVSVLDLKPPEGNRSKEATPLGRFFWDRERHRGAFFCWHLPCSHSYALWIHAGDKHIQAGFVNRDPEGDGELPFVEMPASVDRISAVTLRDVDTQEIVLSGSAR